MGIPHNDNNDGWYECTDGSQKRINRVEVVHVFADQTLFTDMETDVSPNHEGSDGENNGQNGKECSNTERRAEKIKSNAHYYYAALKNYLQEKQAEGINF